MVHKNSHDYVAVLFYASWCPFSRIFRPSFSILSSLYPSIPHFAIEESTIRPRYVFSFAWFFLCIFSLLKITSTNYCSILSKYGVHGFPTLFILNSTMRVRYHGSRTLGSLLGFYSDVTGKSMSTRALLYSDSGLVSLVCLYNFIKKKKYVCTNLLTQLGLQEIF